MDKIYPKEKNGGRETHGRAAWEKEQFTDKLQKTHNLIQVKEYLYPRRPVRPVPWTGQTGARDRSDRLVCRFPLYTISSDG